MTSIRGVDLFCGAGGLTKGLEQSGIDVAMGVDLDPNCAFAFDHNTSATFQLADVSDPKIANLLTEAWGNAEVRLIAGCAPCQPFSSYTQGGRKRRNEDRWNLLRSFANIIGATRPELVTMENVPNLREHPVYDELINGLEALGYGVREGVVDCRQIGLPQSRRRLVLLASRLGDPGWLNFSHPNPQDWVPVRDTIGSLPAIAAGERHDSDPLHQSSSLTSLNLERIRHSKPGGTWRDWPESLRSKCHTKASGRSYPSVYGRMVWDEPSPTLTGQCYGFGNGRFGHPEQDRAISLREASLLQGFPPDYAFSPTDQHVGLLIGNAVPPPLGAAIGLALKAHVQEWQRRREAS